MAPMINAILTTLLAGTVPAVGDLAPLFTITDIDGKRFVLADALKAGPVVLAFFPKAFTTG